MKSNTIQMLRDALAEGIHRAKDELLVIGEDISEATAGVLTRLGIAAPYAEPAEQPTDKKPATRGSSK